MYREFFFPIVDMSLQVMTVRYTIIKPPRQQRQTSCPRSFVCGVEAKEKILSAEDVMPTATTEGRAMNICSFRSMYCSIVNCIPLYFLSHCTKLYSNVKEGL